MVRFVAHILDLVQLVNDFLERMKKDHVGVFAAQASFFLVLSIFPIIMLILTIIGNTSLSMDLVTGLADYMPEEVAPLYLMIVSELYEKASGTIISITAVTAAWTASKGVLSIIRGLNSVYQIEEKRHYLFLRFIAMLYTILLVIGIVFSLVLLVFGTSISHFIAKQIPLLYDIFSVFLHSRQLLAFLMLIVMFLFVYRMVPMKTMSFFSFLPGAVFSAAGWLLFSYFFSLYVNYSGSLSYMYGSLTAVVVLMLWIYICMYILFIGSEINIYFHSAFIHAHGKISQRKQTDSTARSKDSRRPS